MPNVALVYGNSTWPGDFPNADAFTMAYYVFMAPSVGYPPPKSLMSHEYVHVLQFEGRGVGMLDYVLNGGGEPENKYEAIAYLWSGWTHAFGEASFEVFLNPEP